MESIPGDTESHHADGRDAFRERLAGWCIMAFAVLAEAHDSRFHRTMRDTTERHRHDLKAVMAIAAELDVILGELDPRAREVLGAALVREFGIPIGTFTNRGLKRVMNVLARGYARNEDELRLLVDYASDLENPVGLRDQCDTIVHAFQTGMGRRHE